MFQEAIRCRSLSAHSWYCRQLSASCRCRRSSAAAAARVSWSSCACACRAACWYSRRPPGLRPPQAARRRNLVGARVGHHDRDRQRSRSERRDHGLAHQLAELEGRGGQDPAQPGGPGVQLTGAGRRVSIPALLIGAQRLPLISRLRPRRSTLRPRLLVLRCLPGELLCLDLTLPTAPRIRPRAHHAAALPARHRPSRPEQYGPTPAPVYELAIP